MARTIPHYSPNIIDNKIKEYDIGFEAFGSVTAHTWFINHINSLEERIRILEKGEKK